MTAGRDRRDRRDRRSRRGRRRGEAGAGWAGVEVPIRRAPPQWWHAVGPEPRVDYDWVFGAGRAERYGWTGETGRG